MGATHDSDVVVNLYQNAQAVNRRSFSLPMHLTDEVGAGFTEKYRIYASNTEAQGDADLNADAQAAAAAHFSQPLRPPRFAIAKATASYADITGDLDALLADFDGWYGVSIGSRVDADIDELADWALANKQLALVQSSATDILAATPLNAFVVQQSLTNGRGIGLWHHDDDEFADVAWLSAFLSANPDEKSTVAYHKTLIGMTTSSAVTSTQKDNVEGDGGNLYLPFYGVGATGPGKLFDGRFADERLTKDWAVARTEESIAQLLLDMSNRGDKVPFDDNGLAMLEGRLRSVLDRGVSIGHFRAGSVVTSVPSVADGEVDEADIIARTATISGEAILSGAIKKVTVNVGVLSA